MKKIGFYGSGNMAQGMIQGLLAKGQYEKEAVFVYNRKAAPTLEATVATYGVTPILDEKAFFEEVSLIVLAVKPQVLRTLYPSIRKQLTKKHLLVSLAAGISLAELEQGLGAHKLLRAMPNTPLAVLEGTTALVSNTQVTAEEQQLVLQLFQTLGQARFLPESLFDAFIGVSGSAPAYVYLFIEALADGAVLEGMSREDAYAFAAQTVLGSAKMVLETGMHPAVLKDQVCSPGGTTIEAVKSLEETGFRHSIIQAVQAAAKKNRKMQK
ncbi:pyrroline-5-carboxylate reductase [Enterococcus sp. LJL98]